MAGGVAYEGALEGGLFGGMKFWLSMRCTFRERFIKEIKEHGGTVVKLEKMADILVVDNKKFDPNGPPPGAVTWKFIDESLKKGVLEPLENHLATQTTAAKVQRSRPGGSSAPTKSTRSKYTEQEEKALMVYVARKEQQGAQVQGNVIFQEFAATHPTHPWQSWRDKWVKELSYRARPSAEEMAEEEARPSGTVTRAAPAPTQALSQAERLVSLKKRLKLTPEDDELLANYVRECRENGRSVSGNRIFRELAEEFPDHSWHSWRDRWVRHLGLRKEAEEDEEDEDEGAEEAKEAEPEQPAIVAPVAKPEPQARPAKPLKAPPSPSRVGSLQPQSSSAKPAARPIQREPDSLSHKRNELQSTLDTGADESVPTSGPSNDRSKAARTTPSIGRPDKAISPALSRRSVPASNDRRVQDAREAPPKAKTVPAPAPTPAITPPPPTAATTEERDWGRDSIANVELPKIQPRIKGFLVRRALFGDMSTADDEVTGDQREAADEEEAVDDGEAVDEEEATREETDIQESLNWVVKCPCGYTAPEGKMISCPGCKTLQHVSCYYPATEDDINDGAPHYCEECENTEKAATRMEVDDCQPVEPAEPPKVTKITKEVFYRRLNDYMAVTGHRPNPMPTIHKETLTLWDIWCHVAYLDDQHEPRDWEAIAEELDPRWAGVPNVASELETFYAANLAEFERLMHSYKRSLETKADVDQELAALDAGLQTRHSTPKKEKESTPEPEPAPEPEPVVQPGPVVQPKPVLLVDKASNPFDIWDIPPSPDAEDEVPEDEKAESEQEMAPDPQVQTDLKPTPGSEPKLDVEMSYPQLPVPHTYQSSRPVTRGRKRARVEEKEEVRSASPDLGVTPQAHRAKRVRYSKDIEIPSTPPERLEVSVRRTQPQGLEDDTQDSVFRDQPAVLLRLETPMARGGSVKPLRPIEVLLGSTASRLRQGYLKLIPEDEHISPSPVPNRRLLPKPPQMNGKASVQPTSKDEHKSPSPVTKPRALPGSSRKTGKEPVQPTRVSPRTSKGEGKATVDTGDGPTWHKARDNTGSFAPVRTRPPPPATIQNPPKFVPRQPMPTAPPPMAAPRISSMTNRGKERATIDTGYESYRHVERHTTGEYARIRSRKSMPASIEDPPKLVPRRSIPTAPPPMAAPRRPSTTTSRPSMTPSPAPRKTPPTTASRPSRTPNLGFEEVQRRFETLYDRDTVKDLMVGTCCNVHYMNAVLDKIEEARRQGRPIAGVYLPPITDGVRNFWRKKDNANLEILTQLEGKRDKDSTSKYKAALVKLENRFSAEGIQRRREFLRDVPERYAAKK